jgi:hypothetical protein
MGDCEGFRALPDARENHHDRHIMDIEAVRYPYSYPVMFCICIPFMVEMSVEGL